MIADVPASLRDDSWQEAALNPRRERQVALKSALLFLRHAVEADVDGRIVQQALALHRCVARQTNTERTGIHSR